MFIQEKLKRLHYKKLFVYGSYVAIITLGLFAIVVDIFKEYNDLYIDLVYITLTYVAFKRCKKEDNVQRAGLILFWISAFSEFAFLYIHQVDFDIIFAILIPIIAFVALPLRTIIINLILFYSLLISILAYYYFHYPNHPFLHNFKYMFSYFMANAFMIFYGFFYHFAIVESIKRLEQEKEKNSILIKEVHHRVKNNLNLMASILGLQENQGDNKNLKHILSKNRARIEAMAVLHEVLYKGGKGDSLDLKKYIERLISNIIKSESANNRVDILTKAISVKLDMSILIQLGIILNEMITNSLKYSTNSKGYVKIDIEFTKIAEKYYLRYCDNSDIINLENLHKGFGFNLIELSAKQLEGEISINIDKGLCYEIKFNNLEELT